MPPTPSPLKTETMFALDNVQDGETIYQRCVLVTGRCEATPREVNASVRIETKDDAGCVIFPEQQWPMCQGWFKALLILTPGENTINITSGQDDSHKISVSKVTQTLRKSKDGNVDALLDSSAICTTSADATIASGHHGSQRLTPGD